MSTQPVIGTAPSVTLPQTPAVNAVGTNAKPAEAEEKGDVQFMLAELAAMGELWRHTDSRIDTTINFYLTVTAVVLPGLVLLYQAISNMRLFVLAAMPVLGMILVLGFFLVGRVTSTDRLKASYILSLNLIRGFFADRYPHIAAYLFLPVAKPAVTHDLTAGQLRPHFHKSLALLVIGVNSLLIGAILTGSIWLVLRDPRVPTWLILTGAGVSVVGFLILGFLYLKRTGRLK